jgi:sortase A
VIGGIGRVLIAVGVLMFAFVGYQLWGTGIQTAQAQNRLEDEFNELLESAAPSVTQPSDPAATSDPTATSVAPDDVSPSSVPTDADNEATDTNDTTSESTTVPPPSLSPPPLGDLLARLEIPSIGVDNFVVSGVRPTDLERGPGHFPETPLPGQLGNAAMAGHRTTHGQPFFRIDEVQVGDDIVVTNTRGERFVYVMTGQLIVSPNDYQLVIPTVDPSVATLTLTSCHPKYSARQRIVVTAVLDAERSAPVTLPWTAGVPDQPEPSGVIPGDETPATTAAAPESTAPADPAATTPTATVDAGDTVAGDDPTAAAEGQTDGTDETDGTDQTDEIGEELFANRWFSDPDAYPHVGLWGLALIAVALAATALSRRLRRNWVGALAGFAPFVVVLYFWFENVNRLLPPNL